MDIELERKAFETWLEENHPVAGFNVTENECGRYVHRATRMRWEAWLAAKAQATPEGFVLVSREPTEAMLEIGNKQLSAYYAYKAMIEAQEQGCE